MRRSWTFSRADSRIGAPLSSSTLQSATWPLAGSAKTSRAGHERRRDLPEPVADRQRCAPFSVNFTFGASGSADGSRAASAFRYCSANADEARAIASTPVRGWSARVVVLKRDRHAPALRIGDAVGRVGLGLPRRRGRDRRACRGPTRFSAIFVARTSPIRAPSVSDLPVREQRGAALPAHLDARGVDGLRDSRRFDDDARGVQREVVAVEVVRDRRTRACVSGNFGVGAIGDGAGVNAGFGREHGVAGAVELRASPTRGPARAGGRRRRADRRRPCPRSSASCPSCGG